MAPGLVWQGRWRSSRARAFARVNRRRPLRPRRGPVPGQDGIRRTVASSPTLQMSSVVQPNSLTVSKMSVSLTMPMGESVPITTTRRTFEASMVDEQS